MNKAFITISTDDDKPHQTVERELGRFNIGFYCVSCKEFFAFVVVQPKDEPKTEHIGFRADGPILFACPFCHREQRREISEIASFHLTAANQRRPPPPPGLH